MYRINFGKITVKNFMSIGNYPIEWNIAQYKKTLIQGKNFSGKTSLYNAITFALFGRAYSKIKKASLVNTINNKDCLAILELTIQEDSYKIIRGIKPDVFEIYKNGTLIPQPPTVKEYQEYLESNIIKMDFQSYTQLVMLGTSGYKPFLELDAKERRSFVESFLGIEIFTELNKVAKKKAQENTNNQFSYDTKIASSLKNIEILESVINTSNSNKQERIDAINLRLSEGVQENKKLQEEIQQLQGKIDSILVTQDQITEKRKYIGKINSYIAVKENEMQSNVSLIKKIEDNKICVECNQEVSDEHRNKHKEQYISKNRELYDQIAKSKQILSQEESILSKMESDIKIKTKFEQEISMKRFEGNKLKQDMTSIYNEREKLKTEESTDTAIKLQKEKEELALNEEQYAKCVNLHKHYNAVLETLKDSGAKAQIIKNYMPIIVERVNKYLQQLNLFVKFSMDEEFNEVLKSRHRDDFQFESFSMGERMRINMALLFAWRDVARIKTGVESNIILLDEIMEVSDSDGFEEFISLVDLQDNLSCVIISHKSGIEQMFDSVLSVKRVKGFTKIE